MSLKKNVTRSGWLFVCSFSKKLSHDILRQAHSARTAHGSTGICSFTETKWHAAPLRLIYNPNPTVICFNKAPKQCWMCYRLTACQQQVRKPSPPRPASMWCNLWVGQPAEEQGTSALNRIILAGRTKLPDKVHPILDKSWDGSRKHVSSGRGSSLRGRLSARRGQIVGAAREDPCIHPRPSYDSRYRFCLFTVSLNYLDVFVSSKCAQCASTVRHLQQSSSYAVNRLLHHVGNVDKDKHAVFSMMKVNWNMSKLLSGVNAIM